MNPTTFHQLMLHAELSETPDELDVVLRMAAVRRMSRRGLERMRSEWHARRGRVILGAVL